MKFQNLFSFLFLFFLGSLNVFGQGDCFVCTVDLPPLPEDTIYISPVPDGTTGIYYESTMSFRWPITTDPVAETDPDVPPGIAIDGITILSVSNLPPGVTWDIEQTEYNLPEEKDGCVSFCGTPLQPGFYSVEVIVDAEVSILSQTATFVFPMTILPASSTTEGFSMTNNTGCGTVEVSFENNVTSNGMDGFSYFWDFGNGSISLNENPSDQVYNIPGIYEVSYEAIVDTFGYFLSSVIVEDVSCDDLFGNPDLMVEILNPSDSVIFNSNIVNNANPPLEFPINIFIGEGAYKVRVTDDDNGLGGADDLCGVIPFEQTDNGFLEDGDLEVTIAIFHPVDTIQSVDTVFVFSEPDQPFVSGIPSEPVCDGTPVELSIGGGEDIQWYKDSTAVVGAVFNTLEVDASGLYWVIVTNEFGCSAESTVAEITIEELPASPVFTNENNLLTLFPSELLPESFSLKWFLDENLILGENGENYCIEESGSYTLEITDLSTSCTNTFTQNVNFDPDFEGCLTDTEVVEKENSWTIFPNPFTEKVQIKINQPLLSEMTFTIRSAEGKVVLRQFFQQLSENEIIEFNLGQFPSGIYWIEYLSADQRVVQKLIKL